MGCGMTTVKYLLFIFNLIFALFGLALLIAGALSYANIDKVEYFMEKAKNEANFSVSPIALMVVGSTIFVIAFYGCCGAIRESHCMIVTFAVFLLVILIIQIAIGIVAFVTIYGGSWEQAVRDGIRDTFANYHTDTAVQDEVNNLQHNLECCGVDGPAYWTNGTLPSLPLPPPPPGCCINPAPAAQCNFNRQPPEVFEAGCVDQMIQLLKNIGLLLGILAVALGVIEIIGIVFALCLANSIRNSERRSTA